MTGNVLTGRRSQVSRIHNRGFNLYMSDELVFTLRCPPCRISTMITLCNLAVKSTPLIYCSSSITLLDSLWTESVFNPHTLCFLFKNWPLHFPQCSSDSSDRLSRDELQHKAVRRETVITKWPRLSPFTEHDDACWCYDIMSAAGCIFNCVCVVVVGDYYITHHCQSLHPAARWSIQHLPSVIQPTSLAAGRSESTSSGFPPPLPLHSATRSLTQLLNWKTTERDGREEGVATGRWWWWGLQHPGDPVSGLLPLNASWSHPQAQSQPPE